MKGHVSHHHRRLFFKCLEPLCSLKLSLVEEVIDFNHQSSYKKHRKALGDCRQWGNCRLWCILALSLTFGCVNNASWPLADDSIIQQGSRLQDIRSKPKMRQPHTPTWPDIKRAKSNRLILFTRSHAFGLLWLSLCGGWWWWQHLS